MKKEIGQVQDRLTITEVAQIVGVSTKTLTRWEKVGKINKTKRDWRGWRIYDPHEVELIKELKEALFDV
ncbi:MAG: MerR family transcriptional regulator [Candidatus Omnitrophica bacterium]|nr:MerR family transcriptional regulator [Candidatus Omnitrophota bacterium]